MAKRLLSVLLAVCLLVGIAPMALATNINDSTMFFKQQTGSTCTLAATAMMLRRCAFIDGRNDWDSITESSIKSYAWGDRGLHAIKNYKGMSTANYGMEASGYTTTAKKKANLISMLQKHPEGIVLWNPGRSGQKHAILLTDYDSSSDIFYCADPAGGAPKGRIPLSKSTIKGGSQDAKIDVLLSVWYVSDHYGPTPTPPPSGHSTLRSGSTGSEVSLLQSLLNSVQNAGLTVDGKYGPATVAAVKKFQQSRGLTVDGVCGPSTWSALESAKPVGTTSKPSVSVNGQNVTVSWTYSGGGTSIDVYLIQSPWGWNDIKHKQAVSPNSTSCTFTNVAPGYYRAFTIARPNSDTAQSEWAEFSVSEPHTTHTKGSFVRTGTEHPHYNYYSCTVCGQEFTDGSVTPDNSCTSCHWEHVWDDGVVIREPTVSQKGVKRFTCTICNTTKTEDIPELPSYSGSLEEGKIIYDLTSCTVTVTKDGVMYVRGQGNLKGVISALTPKEINSFIQNNVTKIIVEDGITTFNPDVFSSINNLTQVVLPSTLESIGPIFGTDAPIEIVDIPGSVRQIGASINQGGHLREINVDLTNPVYTSDNGVVYSKDMKRLVVCPGKKSGNFTIPDGVTELGDSAMRWCPDLDIVTIPKSVITFGAACFSSPGDNSVGEKFAGKLRVYKNSAAEKYAIAENIPYEVIDDMSLVTFKDVSANAYFSDAVSWAVENGITSGTGNNQFSPNASCTRGQIVTFLWRAAGEPEPQSSISPFSDVKPTDYFYKAVLWAVENNITSGEGNGKFGSGNPCSRGQAMTFIWRAAKEPEAVAANSFADVKSGSYYEKAVNWAVANKVTSGTSATTFSPDESCTRGQIVTFLYRADS